MADRPAAPPPFTKAQKWAISLAGVFFAGLAGLGGYGSFAAVEQEARKYGFTEHSWIVPIGVDLGILALLVVDLILEQLDMSLPPLRWLAWVFTAATIWFNIATVGTTLPWHEQVTGKGMHAAMPLLFIAFMEGVRHAVRRRTGMLSNRRMDGIRLSRWLTDPFGTAGIWRRMVLWEVRSYRTGLVLERHRRERVGALRTQYGWLWRFKAPAEAKWPLRGGMLDLALDLTGALPGAAHRPPEGPPANPITEVGTDGPPMALPKAPAPAAPAGAIASPTPLTSTETGPQQQKTAPPQRPLDEKTNQTASTEAPTAGGQAHVEEITSTEGRETAHRWPSANESAVPGAGDPFAAAPIWDHTPRGRESRTPPVRPDIEETKLAEARDLARGIIRAGSGKVSRRSLKAAGLTGKTETLQEIADYLNEEIAAGLLLDESA
ncbi:DUF2637 domain-containing protein [Streptomyces avidinii]|uniref:DUF2637 domain-containing protein n=1 Tax=Streptomyces avidinii TaxID=1895 RepID=UPI00378EDD7E